MKEELYIPYEGRILIESPSFLKVTHYSGFNKRSLKIESQSLEPREVFVLGEIPIFPDRKKDDISKIVWRSFKSKAEIKNGSVFFSDEFAVNDILQESSSGYLTNLRYYLILNNLGKIKEAQKIKGELNINSTRGLEELIEFTHNF